MVKHTMGENITRPYPSHSMSYELCELVCANFRDALTSHGVCRHSLLTLDTLIRRGVCKLFAWMLADLTPSTGWRVHLSWKQCNLVENTDLYGFEFYLRFQGHWFSKTAVCLTVLARWSVTCTAEIGFANSEMFWKIRISNFWNSMEVDPLSFVN